MKHLLFFSHWYITLDATHRDQPKRLFIFVLSIIHPPCTYSRTQFFFEFTGGGKKSNNPALGVQLSFAWAWSPRCNYGRKFSLARQAGVCKKLRIHTSPPSFGKNKSAVELSRDLVHLLFQPFSALAACHLSTLPRYPCTPAGTLNKSTRPSCVCRDSQTLRAGFWPPSVIWDVGLCKSTPYWNKNSSNFQ